MIGNLVTSLAALAAPWKSAFDNSQVVSGTVMAGHLVALMFSGGFAVAADRGTLRAVKADDAGRTRQLSELAGVHRPVLIGLALSFVTGLLLAAADVETFLGSPVFWIKLVVVALLLGNGLVLVRTERALQWAATPALWSRLARSSWVSLSLWTLTVVLGVALTSAA